MHSSVLLLAFCWLFILTPGPGRGSHQASCPDQWPCQLCPVSADKQSQLICANDNGHCEQYCGADPGAGRFCWCHEGYALQADGMSCAPTGKAPGRVLPLPMSATTLLCVLCG